MGRECSICSHEQRRAIEAEIHRGESYRATAELFGLSDRSLRRHVQEHGFAVIADLAQFTSQAAGQDTPAPDYVTLVMGTQSAIEKPQGSVVPSLASLLATDAERQAIARHLASVRDSHTKITLQLSSLETNIGDLETRFADLHRRIIGGTSTPDGSESYRVIEETLERRRADRDAKRQRLDYLEREWQTGHVRLAELQKGTIPA